MKSRCWLLGVGLLVLGLTFLSAVQSMGQAPRAAKSENPKPFIMWDPGDTTCTWTQPSKDQLNSIIDTVQKKIDVINSRGDFGAALISQIADFYGQNGTLTTHDGLTLRGAREIVLYLQSLLMCRKVAHFEIVVNCIYAKEFTEIFNRGSWKPEDVLQSAYFVLHNSFVLDGHPVSVPGLTIYKHRGSCDQTNDN